MSLVAGATGTGVLLAVLGGVWRLIDERHRLRLDRLAPARLDPPAPLATRAGVEPSFTVAHLGGQEEACGS